jgi:hypothetical protein
VRNLRTIIAVLLSGCAVEGQGGEEPNPWQDNGGSVQVLVSALAPPSNAFDTSTSQFEPGTDNQGWWSPDYASVDRNSNYGTGGFSGTGIRSFFTFDLATLDLTDRMIVSAALQVQGGTAYGDATETIQLFDVSTDPAVLNANVGTSQAIFDDLGTGELYGELDIAASERGTNLGLLWIPLNADARAAITAAAGGFFSVGAALEQLSGLYQEAAFGNTTNAGIQQLVVCFDTDADSDGDGVCDVADDCPEAANADQYDSNGDGVGDACADDDLDGHLNPDDNCPFAENIEQEDGDGDGIGDSCDNCIAIANADQGNRDSDDYGDVCDNCPDVAPGHQDDADGNGIGDWCDDRDDDGHGDVYDNCPDASNPDQADYDGDLSGDACDASSFHDLELRKARAMPLTVKRGRQAPFTLLGRIYNRYDTPEFVQICGTVTEGLPDGCYPAEGFPCSSIEPLDGLSTIDLIAKLPIACAADAAPGRYEVRVEAQIFYESWEGFDEDYSDNTATVTGMLNVR